MVMLLCPVPQKMERGNRFKTQFEQADSAFNEQYRIEMKALKEASKQAVRSAHEKTRKEREKVFKSWNL